MTNDKELTLIGRAEKIDLLDLKLNDISAKVDTGADSSSIWVSSAQESAAGLHVIFFGKGSEHYTGREVIFPNGFKLTRVANSFGQKELRYKLKLRIKIKGKLVRATFTLADRSEKLYPILLGRRLLKGKFVVNVAQGEPLHQEEKKRKAQLRQELNGIKEK
jgi:hypothetical protein